MCIFAVDTTVELLNLNLNFHCTCIVFKHHEIIEGHVGRIPKRITSCKNTQPP